MMSLVHWIWCLEWLCQVSCFYRKVRDILIVHWARYTNHWGKTLCDDYVIDVHSTSPRYPDYWINAPNQTLGSFISWIEGNGQYNIFEKVRKPWQFDDDVIKWKHFPRDWSFVRGIYRSPVNSPHKGQWRGALIFSLICASTNNWADYGDADDWKRQCAHYDVTVMTVSQW